MSTFYEYELEKGLTVLIEVQRMMRKVLRRHPIRLGQPL